MNRPPSRDRAKRKVGGERSEPRRNWGEEKEGRPVDKLLKPPFQLTSCAPDSGANPDWSDH